MSFDIYIIKFENAEQTALAAIPNSTNFDVVAFPPTLDKDITKKDTTKAPKNAINPIADPYVLGVSSGAALGATLSIMLGIGRLFGTNSIGFMAFLLLPA